MNDIDPLILNNFIKVKKAKVGELNLSLLNVDDPIFQCVQLRKELQFAPFDDKLIAIEEAENFEEILECKMKINSDKIRMFIDSILDRIKSIEDPNSNYFPRIELYPKFLTHFNKQNQDRWSNLKDILQSIYNKFSSLSSNGNEENICEMEDINESAKILFNRNEFSSLLKKGFCCYNCYKKIPPCFYSSDILDLITALNMSFRDLFMPFFSYVEQISECIYKEDQNEKFLEYIEKMNQSIIDTFDLITLIFNIGIKILEKNGKSVVIQNQI